MKPFLFSFLMLLGLGLWAQDTNFVKINTWSFDNYTKADSLITWEMYRQNYIGIPPSYGDANPFEQALFDHVYTTELFPKGLCFGMDLMAIQLLRYGGYDGFCAPAYIYPGIPDNGPVNPDLVSAIEMQMGRQLGHRFLLHILDNIAQGKNRDGNYVYSQFLYYQSKKEPMTISVTKGLTPADGGHSLLPYFAEDLGATKRIYVYDVNRCFHYNDNPGTVTLEHKSWYMNRENFIEINSSNGQWRYYMVNDTLPPFGELWQGSPSSGGSLVVFPFSVMNVKDRLPQSLFADAAEAIAKIFIFGEETTLSQITTPDGRSFLDEATNDMNTDPHTALRSVYSFVPINGGQTLNSNSSLYFVRGEQDFDLTIKSGPEGFEVQLFSDKNTITLTGKAPNQTVAISIRGIHNYMPEVRCTDHDVAVEVKSLPWVMVGER